MKWKEAQRSLLRQIEAMKELSAALREVEKAPLTPESRVELIAEQINTLALIRWMQQLADDSTTECPRPPKDVDLSYIPKLPIA